MTLRNHWIGVVSRSHVEIGVKGSFIQLSHDVSGCAGTVPMAFKFPQTAGAWMGLIGLSS